MACPALRSESAPLSPLTGKDPAFLITLFGEGSGAHRPQGGLLVVSYLGHILAVALWLAGSRFMVADRREVRQEQLTMIETKSIPYVLPAATSNVGGGGGGGDWDKLPASKGVPPRFARGQVATPTVVVRNEDPRLPVEATVIVPPEIHFLLQAGSLGDPLSSILGLPSSGTGRGGGIGSGSHGGVGSGRGPGVGPGWGGGIGAGAYRAGGGVTAPRAIYTPEPEFSEEARKARFQGTVVLWLIVGPDGRTREVRVYRSLGMGLEKAIETIRQWRFDPGHKDGVPVPVQVTVEVSFLLY